MIQRTSAVLGSGCILLILFQNCRQPAGPGIEIQMLENTDVEAGSFGPTHWFSHHSDNTTTSWSDEHCVSPIHSLKIQINTDLPGDERGGWYQTIRSDIPAGKELTLRAYVKSVNSWPKGITLTIICFNRTAGVLASASNLPEYSIGATRDWDEYSVALTDVPKNTDLIQVSLSLHSQGTAYFDDITLSYLDRN